ncbi:MAG: transglutaminase-like domain-containing protein [Planctomycetota bacterium]
MFSFLAISLSLFPFLAAQQSGELLPNPGFKDGGKDCVLKGAELSEYKGPKKGMQTVALHGAPGAGQWTNVGFRIADPPTGRKLKFRVDLLAEHRGHTLTINTFAYADGREKLKQWSEKFDLKKGKWEEAEQTYVLPDGVKQLEIWVINQETRSVFVAGPSLIGGDPAPERLKNLTKAGVLLASANVSVRQGEKQEAGVVTFPIPLINEHQVPLTFDLLVEPPDALVGYRWVQREDGLNWLCEAEIHPPKEGAQVRWESMVVVLPRKDKRLPAASKEPAPEETAVWLQSTACIQSADEDIVAKAQELGAGKKSTGKFVENVLAFTSSHQGDPGAEFKTLDARAALDCGGSCTSRANLAAALFRAGGIPARTSAHLPTWSGPLYEHWHVEYWHPGAGWTWVEPTLGKLRPQPISMVVLNVANPGDEDQGFDPIISHSGVMIGVPRFSVHELSESIAYRPLPGIGFEKNWAKPLAHLDGSKSSIKKLENLARESWEVLKAENLVGEANRKRREELEACFEDALILKKKVTSSLTKALKP